MAFGSKQPSFRPTSYGYKRSRRGIPRWLILLITGIIIGAGGVVFLQRSYGPKRLTVEQSEQLRIDLNSSTLENQRLIAENKKNTEEITNSQRNISDLENKIATLEKNNEEIKSGVNSLINAIPPDPRGGNPGIRGADMVLQEDGLNYRVLLIQKENPEQALENFTGTVKLIAIGTYSNGNTGYVDIATNELDMGLYTVVSGLTELPKGFRINQVTIQITAAGSDKVISTRTIRVARK